MPESRRPAGDARGGQFAPSQRAEDPDLDLAAPDQPDQPDQADPSWVRLHRLASDHAASALRDLDEAKSSGDPEAEGAARSHLEAAARAHVVLAGGLDRKSSRTLNRETRDLEKTDLDDWPSTPETLRATDAEAARDEFYRRSINAAMSHRLQSYRFRDDETPPSPYDIDVLYDRGSVATDIETNAYWACAIDAGGEPDPRVVERVVADAHEWTEGSFLEHQKYGEPRVSDWASAVGGTDPDVDYWSAPITDRYPA